MKYIILVLLFLVYPGACRAEQPDLAQRNMLHEGYDAKGFYDMANGILPGPRADPARIAALLYGLGYTAAGIALMRRERQHRKAAPDAPARRDARKAFLAAGLFILAYVVVRLAGPYLLPADPVPKLKCIEPEPGICGGFVPVHPVTGEPLPPGGYKGPYFFTMFVWSQCVPLMALYPWLHLLVQKKWRAGLAGLACVAVTYMAVMALPGM